MNLMIYFLIKIFHLYNLKKKLNLSLSKLGQYICIRKGHTLFLLNLELIVFKHSEVTSIGPWMQLNPYHVPFYIDFITLVLGHFLKIKTYQNKISFYYQTNIGNDLIHQK